MITLNIPTTAEQEAKLANWFARVNPQYTTPYASLEDLLIDMVKDTVTAAIQSQEAPDIQEVWDSLTQDQRDRIKAIVQEP